MMFQNRQSRSSFFRGDRYVKEYYGSLENIKPYQLFHQVPFPDDGVEADHHQYSAEPVVVFSNDEIKHNSPYFFLFLFKRKIQAMPAENMTAVSPIVSYPL